MNTPQTWGRNEEGKRSFVFMEWISVKRRLPDNDAPVLVAAGERITIAYWDAVEGRFKMLSREDATMILSGDVTHWTPLPELPQEKRND